MFKISIITINYNNLEGLKRTVESVINQTSQEFEYIVIDGGSKDGSVDYIKSQSGHFDYWVSEPDKGIYNAMNKGIVKATGEYLLFLNSGDHFFCDEVIKKNRQYVDKYDLIYFNLKMVRGDSSKVASCPDILRFSDLYFGSLPHPATFVKKTLFEKVGLYDEKLKIVSDWKFFILALFKHNCSYFKVNDILSIFYMDGISSDFENNEMHYKERQLILNSYFNEYVEDLNQLLELKKIVLSLRKSKKISLLIKLGLLQKF